MVSASFVVLGPRSFSKMVPDSSTMKVIPPGERYSADYATNEKPPVLFPSALQSGKGLPALGPNWEVQRDCQTVEVISNRKQKPSGAMSRSEMPAR
jgi:hypothetical protein